jgi:hypothetical protein
MMPFETQVSEITYSFCIALTTARENGAEEAVLLVIKGRVRVGRYMKSRKWRQGAHLRWELDA